MPGRDRLSRKGILASGFKKGRNINRSIVEILKNINYKKGEFKSTL